VTRSLVRRVLLLAGVAATALLPLQAAVQSVTTSLGGSIATMNGSTAGRHAALLAMFSAGVGVAVLWRRPGNLVAALLRGRS